MSTPEPALLEALAEPEAPRPLNPWEDDAAAAAIVRKDFETAENYIETNHMPRWALADQLFVGYEKQKYWKGTKQPRSSLGVFVVFQQVESLLPTILSTVFGDNPWFEVGPQPGTSATDARLARDLILYQMELARRYKNQSVREVFRRAFKSGFLYGNGIVELYWMDRVREVRKLYRQQVAETAPHPLYGVAMPTGRTRSVLGEEIVQKREQFPCMRNVSVKDFFIDPNCEGPQVQLGGYAGKRALMTADEIRELGRYDERFKIPSDAELEELCNKKSSSAGDMAKRWAEQTRSVDWSPEEDSSAAPGAKRAEVLCYYRPDRCVWTINRDEWTLLNIPNDIGFIPFFNAFYTDVPDRFYGLSVADVTEGEHRLQGGIINARLDELSLTLHGTTVKRRGFSIPNSQLQRRPGQIIEAENPKEDIVFGQTQNITQNAFVEVAASELRTQKNTGVTDLAIQGVPSAGGNSANRTATGVGAQVRAAQTRINYLIENSEDTFVEPILTAQHAMNTRFLDPEQLLSILDPYGKQMNIDPIRILNSEVIFTMRASSKMQSRMALIQQFPALAQALLNPGVLAAMSSTGLTLDWGEFLQIFTDATSYAMRGTLIRPMTPEEQQAFQRSQQMEQNGKLQLQRERMKDLETLEEKKQRGELVKETAKIALTAALEPEDEGESGE